MAVRVRKYNGWKDNDVVLPRCCGLLVTIDPYRQEPVTCLLELRSRVDFLLHLLAGGTPFSTEGDPYGPAGIDRVCTRLFDTVVPAGGGLPLRSHADVKNVCDGQESNHSHL